jgi:hypothetical protein
VGAVPKAESNFSRSSAYASLQPMLRGRLFLLAALAVACLTAFAQPAADQVSFDNSFITLAGPWKFAPGDAPQAGGALIWANAEFKDAGWSNMDLRAQSSETDPGYGTAGYLKGWTARGFPHLSGFAWYRLRMPPASASRSWLRGDESFQPGTDR